MRLTGGLDRGRRLIAPRGARTRPTASRVREALFNILGPPAGPVLDLYAGTGALGMEALRRNLRETKMDDRAEVIGADVRAALRRLGAQNDKFGPFSWVFLDPPYVRETEGLLGELCGLDMLSNCAVVVVEHDRRHRPAERVGCLFLTDRRQYGDTELSFFRSSGS